jgi:eukaryotic-like serine/threonine-protein kinase
MADPSRVEGIFFAALEKPSRAEREAFLAHAYGGDEELRRQVERLLAGHDQASGFLEHPPIELQATVDRPNADSIGVGQPPQEDLSGTSVGPYKLLEQIGEGGMGIVYMAEQAVPLRRRVAVKIIKPGLDTRQVIARFEAERQALALMDHPNIARVFDAGAIDHGRPYFVMELVHGVPITNYCDQNNLSARQHSTPIKRGSFIATSSRRMCWSRSMMATQCRK